MTDSPQLPACVVDTSVFIDLHRGRQTLRCLLCGFYR
jgi:hypothetical protein